MKKLVKNVIWKLVCAFVVCAIIAISLATCEKDECKECTNKITNETKKLCGDELLEARLSKDFTCKL